MGRDVPGLYFLSVGMNRVADQSLLVLVNDGLESVIFQPDVSMFISGYLSTLDLALTEFVL